MSNIKGIFKELKQVSTVNEEQVNEASKAAEDIRKETDKNLVSWTKDEFNKVKDLVSAAGADYVGLSGKGYILIKKSKSGSKASIKMYKKANDQDKVVYHLSGEMDLKIKNHPESTEENELENDYVNLNRCVRAAVNYLDKMESKHKEVWDARRDAYYSKRNSSAEKANEEQNLDEEVITKFFGYLDEEGTIIDMRDPEEFKEVTKEQLDEEFDEYEIQANGDIYYVVREEVSEENVDESTEEDSKDKKYDYRRYGFTVNLKAQGTDDLIDVSLHGNKLGTISFEDFREWRNRYVVPQCVKDSNVDEEHLDEEWDLDIIKQTFEDEGFKVLRVRQSKNNPDDVSVIIAKKSDLTDATKLGNELGVTVKVPV